MTMFKFGFRIIAAASITAAISACAVRGEATRLQMPLPGAWDEPVSAGQAPSQTWWSGFGSEQLNRLVETALEGNPDLKIAGERIRSAEAAVASTDASLFPSLNLGVSTNARRSDGDGVTARSESTSSILAVSYELDLWGRLNANLRAGQASLESVRRDADVARLTLISGVATAYFQVLAVQARRRIVLENVAIAERLLRIVDVRYRNGAASRLDLSRQQTTVLTQRAVLLPLHVQERQIVRALAILLGQPPQSFALNAEDLWRLSMPDTAPALPAELITRRPDLARAEAQLLAADANLDAARAALLPGLQLSLSASSASSAAMSLASGTAALSIGASLSQSIFDGGRLRSQVDASDAQRLQLLETYRKAILTALKEVDDGLSNVMRDREQESSQTAIRDEAQRSLRLAELRYREGAADLTSVLDAQRALYSADDQLAQLRLARLNSAVDLVKALGGPPGPAAGRMATTEEERR